MEFADRRSNVTSTDSVDCFLPEFAYFAHAFFRGLGGRSEAAPFQWRVFSPPCRPSSANFPG
jgi:hypothetical protein